MATVIFVSPAAHECMKKAFLSDPEVHIVMDPSARESWRFGLAREVFNRLNKWAAIAEGAVNVAGLNKNLSKPS